jgi:hypothetical protein
MAAHQGPGPVGGGTTYGYLWSEHGTVRPLETVSDMETWLNTRLAVVEQPMMSFERQQHFTTRHMDLVRRSICILPDSRICFFNWEFAGFYPPIFKVQVPETCEPQTTSGLTSFSTTPQHLTQTRSRFCSF